LNVGAVVTNKQLADGIQKGADVFGLHVDLFVASSAEDRQSLIVELANNKSACLIFENLPEEPSKQVTKVLKDINARRKGQLGPLPIATFSSYALATDVIEIGSDPFKAGYNAIKAMRTRLLPQIPKFDELLPIGFPITPIPDNFLQLTKFPYPEPVLRSPRTV